jgi:pyridoxal phosphate enzyme (YggS family)
MTSTEQPDADSAHLERILARNRDDVLARIARACERAGREPGEVTLVAITKSLTLPATAALARIGQRDLGESRVAVLEEKLPQLRQLGLDVRWHLVGHIQRRKVPRLVALAPALLHSLDSLRLLESIAARQTPGEALPVLVQVNVSGEEQKGGFAPEALAGILDRVAATEGLEARGLMTMAPFAAEPEATRPIFRALRELRNAQRARHEGLSELSMGMTNDFEVAVEEGATLVRVGSALAADLPPTARVG